MNKRNFIKTSLLGIAGLSAVNLKANNLIKSNIQNGFALAELPYAFTDINTIFSEDAISEHYNTHYTSFNKSLNKELNKLVFKPKNTREILIKSNIYSKSIIDSASGYFNHRLFFRLINPNNRSISNSELKNEINKSFGSEETLFKEFTIKAKELKDNGWLWLVMQDRKLRIITTIANNNPFLNNINTNLKGFPIIAIDMWDHAYEPNYGNNKEAYIQAILNNLNWKIAEKRFQQSRLI